MSGPLPPSPARRAFRLAALLIGGALVVGLAALALWFLRPTADSDAPAETPTPLVALASSESAGEAEGEPVVDADDEDLPPAVKRYLESTIYPPGSGRLTEAHEDLLNPNQRYEDFRKVLDTYSEDPNQVVSVRFTTSRFFFTGEEEIELSLQVRRGSATITPLSVQAKATREGRSGAEGNPIPIRFHPQGEGLVATVDSARFADHHGPVFVSARIEYAPGAYYDETLRFFYTPSNKIPARFTGKFSDSLTGGSLRVGIGLDVQQPGFYRIDANLYDRLGKPIGFSAFKGNLDAGERFVPIQFFGRILRDVGADGPYRVGEIRGYRFLESQYPDRERIPDFEGQHQTARYRARNFSDDDFDSEHKQRMVQLLLEDVARGISIDAPPLATGSPVAGAGAGVVDASSSENAGAGED